MAGHRKSFGERNFGGADLGDGRRSRRLPKLVDEMERHPGGTLPQKLPRPEDLEAFYRPGSTKVTATQKTPSP